MKKRQTHNYTSELELKSLLIRIKNTREERGSLKDNNKINKYVKWHTKINNKKYQDPKKKNIVKNKLKDRVVSLSEKTRVDDKSYNRFGEIILLMIRKILTKPQFSGYTYRDDFYSDAVHKILKYLCNFNHKLISEITNQPVNSFAYISQIIHNSVLYIINTKKKELDEVKKQVSMEFLNNDLTLKNNETYNRSTYFKDETVIKKIEIETIKTTLFDKISKIDIGDADRIDIIYPEDYSISFEEYDKLKPLLKGKMNISRKRSKDD